MTAFDALGPLTRRVISEAPESLDAHKLPDLVGVSLYQLCRFDAEIAHTLADMIAAEYGSRPAA